MMMNPAIMLIVCSHSILSNLQKRPKISHKVIKTPNQANALVKNITRKFQISLIRLVILFQFKHIPFFVFASFIYMKFDNALTAIPEGSHKHLMILQVFPSYRFSNL